MEINELLTVNYKNGYYFVVCKNDIDSYIIMRFNYHNYGLNLSSEHTYTKLTHAIVAGKNIINNHWKRQGYKNKN